ncbi:MAG: hypothetical protein KJ018_17875 [Burkholderiales bacterium]|nr:hypothetical protein [Burkholderiales bacterium]
MNEPAAQGRRTRMRRAKRPEADIANIREGRDTAARRFSLAFAQRIPDSGR